MTHLKHVGLMLVLAALYVPVATATPVNVELLMLVDVSGSIDNSEFNLQRTGYANAFFDPAVQTLIANNPGGVAASLVYWSGRNQQQVVVGWTHLFDAASAIAFGNAIAAAARPYFGLTAVQSALAYGAPLFADNGFEGNKLIVDISGDGSDNNSPAGLLPTGGRDAALAVGAVINGLVIGTAGGPVWNYYSANVIGGGGLLYQADDFGDFNSAIRQKIFYEVGGIPEPTTWLLIGSGVIALAWFRRKARA
jgi:hypothetical protein